MTAITNCVGEIPKKYKPVIERVQKEFLNQMLQGQTKEEALAHAIDTFDKKHNLKEDEFAGPKNNSYCGSCGGPYKIKFPTATQILEGLNFFAELIPLIIRIIEILPKSQPQAVPSALRANVAELQTEC